MCLELCIYSSFDSSDSSALLEKLPTECPKWSLRLSTLSPWLWILEVVQLKTLLFLFAQHCGVLLYHVPVLCMCAQACSTPGDPHGLQPTRLLCPWNFPHKNLEWVAIYSSRGSSWPRDWAQVFSISCIGKWFLYHWTTWEAPCMCVVLRKNSRRFMCWFLVLVLINLTFHRNSALHLPGISSSLNWLSSPLSSYLLCTVVSQEVPLIRKLVSCMDQSFFLSEITVLPVG